MPDKKILGDNPLESAQLEEDSLAFIPDRSKNINSNKESNFKRSRTKHKKKIVSYSLDARLVKRLKRAALDQNRFYSSLVNEAIHDYLERSES